MTGPIPCADYARWQPGAVESKSASLAYLELVLLASFALLKYRLHSRRVIDIALRAVARNTPKVKVVSLLLSRVKVLA